MIPAVTYKDKTVAVFGLGASGLASVASLLAGGATVRAWDDAEATREKADSAGVPLTDLRNADWTQFAALVLAPGVPLTHPEPHWTVKQAKAAQVPVIGDTEVFVQSLMQASGASHLVAITGTNGKSTTTALIGHILKSAGRDTEVGGNIGTAVLQLGEPGAGRHYVVEFSSYQIDLTPSLKPDTAILLNLTPDHLDRHGDMAGYAAVKAKIFARQDEADLAVIGVDDEYCAEIAAQITRPAVQHISVEREVSDGAYVSGSVLHEVAQGADVANCSLAGIDGLRGRHNWQNAAAAWAACRKAGLSEQEIAAGFASFPGLVHRMEQVARCGDILFINDSKATNADAAARALDSFDNIYWIAGGLAKTGGIEELKPFFPRIRRAYLIGAAAVDFAQTLSGQADTQQCGTLDVAVAKAFDDARRDGGPAVVLFSPACASFDQYRNFEIRGDAFRAAVAALDGVSMSSQEAA
ncbi:MAG: UDP-N-acetylmuramoyl-L-alanine--D-glutamate ligase [Alphaproteobacteria bacterium]|nr:UDP-N-acetylmuramoyl-L-alanine--D-glutamate ligase [Alphaproteobacteria bacterium]